MEPITIEKFERIIKAYKSRFLRLAQTESAQFEELMRMLSDGNFSTLHENKLAELVDKRRNAEEEALNQFRQKMKDFVDLLKKSVD